MIQVLGYLEEAELRILRIKRSNCARLVHALLQQMDEAAKRTY